MSKTIPHPMRAERRALSLALAVSLALVPNLAFAGQAGGGSQLLGGVTNTLNDVIGGLTGPIGIGVVTIAIVIFGLMWAVGEAQSPMRRGGQILFGGTLVFMAAGMASNLASGAIL